MYEHESMKILKWLKSLFKKKPKLKLVETPREQEPLVYSPLLSYPRNKPCYCESGIKYKKCCWKDEIRAVPLSVALKMLPQVQEARGK